MARPYTLNPLSLESYTQDSFLPEYSILGNLQNSPHSRDALSLKFRGLGSARGWVLSSRSSVRFNILDLYL